MLNSSLEFRFWSNVRMGPKCWEWMASKYLNGYGQFVIRGEKRAPAHRTSYRLSFGEIPNGMCVLHHCDNPGCVRPDHLFLGTRADNIADAKRKGRLALGEMAGSAKLTSKEVRSIRNGFASGATETMLARKFHVSQSAVSKIVRATRWHHLGIVPINSSGRQAKGERCACSKLKRTDVRRIRKLAERGTSNASLSRKFKVSKVLIGLIVRRKIWKWLD